MRLSYTCFMTTLTHEWLIYFIWGSTSWDGNLWRLGGRSHNKIFDAKDQGQKSVLSRNSKRIVACKRGDILRIFEMLLLTWSPYLSVSFYRHCSLQMMSKYVLKHVFAHLISFLCCPKKADKKPVYVEKQQQESANVCLESNIFYPHNLIVDNKG